MANNFRNLKHMTLEQWENIYPLPYRITCLNKTPTVVSKNIKYFQQSWFVSITPDPLILIKSNVAESHGLLNPKLLSPEDRSIQ